MRGQTVAMYLDHLDRPVPESVAAQYSPPSQPTWFPQGPLAPPFEGPIPPGYTLPALPPPNLQGNGFGPVPPVMFGYGPPPPIWGPIPHAPPQSNQSDYTPTMATPMMSMPPSPPHQTHPMDSVNIPVNSPGNVIPVSFILRDDAHEEAYEE